jgi:ribosomal protein S6
MKTYELTYIVSPEITSEETESKAKEFEAKIQSIEGTVLKQKNPNAITLAYPIKNRASGFLGIIEFQIEPEKISELEEAVAKDDKIVRHTIVIKKPMSLRRERRPRIKPISILKTEEEKETKIEEEKISSKKVSEEKQKVELKDIEQKLDEILG